MQRRHFLTRSARTFLGVGMLPAGEALFGSRSMAAAIAASEEKILPKFRVKAKNIIYLYMSGGMSHLDTFGVKPGHSNMGATSVIPTNVDGIRISEYLPRLAQCADKMAIVNSLTSNQGAHEQGNYIQHTSYALRGTIRHPSLGAWMERLQEKVNETMPTSVVIGGGSQHPGAGFMEARFSPVAINNPASGLTNSRLPGGVVQNTFDYRLDLSQKLDQEFQNQYDLRDVRAYTSMYRDAVRLMASPDLKAFDITQENEHTRKLYGETPFGQGCLLARRLVENGVRFVEVNLGGWDTHQANFIKVPENCDTLDKGFATLLEDLAQRGLLEETMVVLATEFGRTPTINQNEGRDHYPKAFSGVLAGAGVRGGQIYGKTSEDGTTVTEGALSPSDFNATIATALGMPLDHIIHSPSRRPFTIADKGKPALGLLA